MCFFSTKPDIIGFTIDEKDTMTQIKNIARFTTPVKLPIFSTTQDTKENSPVKKKTLPEILVKLNEERHATKETMLDFIELVLTESEQPLTVNELTTKVSADLDRVYDPNPIRLFLKELEAAGRVSSRVETNKERSVRAAGKKVRNLNAALWWAPAGEVPERTVTEAVPGVILTDESGRKPGKKISKLLKVKSITPVETPAIAVENPIIDYVVEKLVAERTAGLQEELARTKAELESIKELIRSAVNKA